MRRLAEQNNWIVTSGAGCLLGASKRPVTAGNNTFHDFWMAFRPEVTANFQSFSNEVYPYTQSIQHLAQHGKLKALDTNHSRKLLYRQPTPSLLKQKPGPRTTIHILNPCCNIQNPIIEEHICHREGFLGGVKEGCSIIHSGFGLLCYQIGYILPES